jgi:Ca2+-binding EF-hand superfamily protein
MGAVNAVNRVRKILAKRPEQRTSAELDLLVQETASVTFCRGLDPAAHRDLCCMLRLRPVGPDERILLYAQLCIVFTGAATAHAAAAAVTVSSSSITTPLMSSRSSNTSARHSVQVEHAAIGETEEGGGGDGDDNHNADDDSGSVSVRSGGGDADDGELAEAFALMDVQRRGEVDFDEFKLGMKGAGFVVSEEEAREIFDTADLDGGGTIDFDEFSEVMQEKVDGSAGSAVGGTRRRSKILEGGKGGGPAGEGDGALDDKELEDAFALMDVQRRGEVDFDEFKLGMTLAGMVVSEVEAREIFDTADLDGGGTIDYEEFSEVMREKLDDGGGGSHRGADDSLQIAGLEGFWQRTSGTVDAGCGSNIHTTRSMKKDTIFATRVMVKGDCVGSSALDAVAAAMVNKPDEATATLARAIAEPLTAVTLIALEKNTELMTLSATDLARVRGAPGGFEGWIAARVAVLTSCALFHGVVARRTDLRSLAAAATERNLELKTQPCRAGEPGEELFIVTEGQYAVIADGGTTGAVTRAAGGGRARARTGTGAKASSSAGVTRGVSSGSSNGDGGGSRPTTSITSVPRMRLGHTGGPSRKIATGIETALLGAGGWFGESALVGAHMFKD